MGSEAEIMAGKILCYPRRTSPPLSAIRRLPLCCWRFKEEIVPIEVKQKKDVVVVDNDQPIRGDTSMDALAKLMPVSSRVAQLLPPVPEA